MEELRYPIGMQTFSQIIENGYTYVDKTGYIPLLLKQGKYIFLSRPRRFGKSLLVSTLKAYFQGRRSLFKGLAIDHAELEWTPSPILHFDFNSEDFSKEDGLDLLLDIQLREYEKVYGRDSEDISPSQRFRSLIRNAFEQTGRKVVILVDEYDKPLLSVENNVGLFEKNQQLLKGFFGNLKTMDSKIRFCFLTGVARFNKVSIFSDLNNLDDISFEDAYSDICGISEQELILTFRSGIENLSDYLGLNYDTTLSLLRNYYDGYLFTPKGSRLYNPFSVLRALKAKSLDPYWFETGTPTFLVKRIKANSIDPADINGRKFTKRDLTQVGLDSRDPIPLMFQTGYLTIDEYDPVRQRYTLRFPNREVEIGFAEALLPLYVHDVMNSSSPFSLFSFQDDLYDGKPEEFMNRLATLFKDFPGEDHRESTYRAVTYLLCKLCSLDSRAEHRSYKGRSDLEVFTPEYIYIFEFKYNKSIREAMDQIHARDYAGRHDLDHRTLYLIGVNYSEASRSLQYEIRRR